MIKSEDICNINSIQIKNSKMIKKNVCGRNGEKYTKSKPKSLLVSDKSKPNKQTNDKITILTDKQRSPKQTYLDSTSKNLTNTPKVRPNMSNRAVNIPYQQSSPNEYSPTGFDNFSNAFPPINRLNRNWSHSSQNYQLQNNFCNNFENLQISNHNLSNGSINGKVYTDHSKLSKTNLYIKSLPTEANDEYLRLLCAPYGPIVSTKAILDPNDNNKCKGYGFVDFETQHDAELAVRELNSKHIPAQMAKQQEQDPTNLYFSNIPIEIKESDLEEILYLFGVVVSTRILRDCDSKSKGVGFARMENASVCDTIIDYFNGYNFKQIYENLNKMNKNQKLLINSKELTFVDEDVICKLADGGPKKRTNNFRRPNFGIGLQWSELPAEATLYDHFIQPQEKFLNVAGLVLEKYGSSPYFVGGNGGVYGNKMVQYVD